MQCNAMQCNAMQCNAMQCNAMQCNAMQCNATQCKAMQCNAMRCDAMRCDAMRCDAMQCNGSITFHTCLQEYLRDIGHIVRNFQRGYALNPCFPFRDIATYKCSKLHTLTIEHLWSRCPTLPYMRV